MELGLHRADPGFKWIYWIPSPDILYLSYANPQQCYQLVCVLSIIHLIYPMATPWASSCTAREDNSITV